jgi:O-antigen biosynthesis protein
MAQMIRLAEMREQAASFRAHNIQLTQQLQHLETKLESVVGSPAWNAIQQYRLWLEGKQIHHPGFFRYYEKLAALLLKLFGIIAGSPASLKPRNSQDPPVSSPEPGRSLAEPAKVQARDAIYQKWIEENEPGPRQLREQTAAGAILSRRPMFSVILPVYEVSSSVLQECIDSVLNQSYDRWELCIVDANPASSVNRQLLLATAAREPRVRLVSLEENLGISANSNIAIKMALGDYLAFLDHDDSLAPFALFEAACLLNETPDTDILYSDHDYLERESGLRFDPLFKPAWSPEIMFSANYITHLTIVRRSLVEEGGSFDSLTDGAQDWDLFLRLVEKTQRIQRISKVLYHWRVHPGSTALNYAAKDYARNSQLLSIRRHMQRIGMPAEPEVTSDGLMHVSWKWTEKPLVSIVIPSRDKVELLSRCVSSLLENTDYPAYEILIVDNQSVEPETHSCYSRLLDTGHVRILDFPGPFNYSAANNFGAAQARGELVLFLNNDVEITRPDWLDELAGWALYSPIGIVGARLLRENGTIQHAGIVIGLGGFAGHTFENHPRHTYNIFGSTAWYRNYLAVTGACMIMRMKTFDELGGFDENFILCGSDVDICLRSWQKGYRVVYNPFAELIHYESQTRKAAVAAEDFFVSYERYQPYLEKEDPYWSPNLSLWEKDMVCRRKAEPSSLGFVLNHLSQLRLTAEETPAAYIEAVPKPAEDAESGEEARIVSWFDFSEEELRRSLGLADAVKGYRTMTSLIWFIPPFENAFYGGIHTILRFADYWHRQRGVRSFFAICGQADAALMAGRIRGVYRDIGQSQVYVLQGVDDVRELPPADGCVATLWSTAYYALRFDKAPRKFYLIQDYEPSFYRAGAASALAEATYRFGFYGITNTISLQRTYEAEYQGKAIHFTPCVDLQVFNSNGRPSRKPGPPWQVFCYARPHHPRNAFRLLVAAMGVLKKRLGDRVNIVCAGSDWNVSEYGLQGVAVNLGVLPYGKTAELYRSSDVGVALMLTRHPSYIPLELMASGCLVVTNKNSWTTWLFADGENCLLSDPSPSCLAAKVELALTNELLRRKVTEAAEALVRGSHADWTPEMERIYEFMCDPESEFSSTQAGMVNGVHNR